MSPECHAEIEQANLQKKRLLPIQIQDGFDKGILHDSLRLPQWTLLRPIDDFQNGMRSLMEAINTDFDLLVVHTCLTQRAADWDARGRPGSAFTRCSVSAMDSRYRGRSCGSSYSENAPTLGGNPSDAYRDIPQDTIFTTPARQADQPRKNVGAKRDGSNIREAMACREETCKSYKLRP